MGRHPKPTPVRRPNPLSTLKPIRNPPQVLMRATQGAAKAKARRICPNKQCTNPKIEDGTCINCGTIVDDANIVAEVQFGENSSGAAVVQGSFVGSDQGGAKSLGPAFRRAGGNEPDKEKTNREGKRIMMGFAAEHKLSESAVNAGMQIFKMATFQNLVQGRRINMVAAACLYAACRRERPCRVMLIDFADSCQCNVFKLGHCFKAIHKKLFLGNGGMLPILPEDLIYRFATKLEFGLETDRVAEAAVRLVNRMSRDWMVMGRRPSGICGACLLLAARMHNFRRTVTEVVYIVKVTTTTLQKRLDEFQFTASSEMTVEAFLGSDFLESAHDPPSFYQKTEAYLAQKKTRKRKKPHELGDDEPRESHVPAVTTHQPAVAESHPQNVPGSMAPPPIPQHIEQENDSSPTPSEPPIDPALLAAIDEEDPRTLETLAAEHGDIPVVSAAASDGAAVTAATGQDKGKGKRGRPARAPSVVDEEWEEEEAVLESEITEMINDPGSLEHARAFSTAEQRARVHTMLAIANAPQREIPMTETIEEDEFADDPEVNNCLLSEAESLVKERIWVNNNKDWLRDQQQKEFDQKMAKMGPPKAKRNRKKEPRMGEGQESAASSPMEATTGAMKRRALSKKINYEAIGALFTTGTTSVLGSATTSRVTSRANSLAPTSITASVAGSAAGSVAGDSIDERDTLPMSGIGNEVVGDDDDEGDASDYVDEPQGDDPDAGWRSQFVNDDGTANDGDDFFE